MQVYSHYHIGEQNIAYRWRTLLQFGNSWDVIGTTFLQHPGTTTPTDAVKDADTLAHLTALGNENASTWHTFKPCPTMRAIASLFTERNGGKELEGVIQIFHLTNVCGGEKKTATYDPKYAYTSSIDNTLLASPIYLGWGDATKLLLHLRTIAHQVFSLATAPAFDLHYLTNYFEKNAFVHPLSLMVTNKDAFESVLFRRCFLENTTKPKGINELLHQHHVAVKNASRCQEILEFLPSFNIAPLSTPKRTANNSLVLEASNGVQVEVVCEENDFSLTVFHGKKDVEAVIPLANTLSAYGFKADKRNDLQSYTKLIPVYFVENIYNDIQIIATALRKAES